MDLAEKIGTTVYRHPWEISRASCVLDLARDLLAAGPLADIGSGDLYFADRLQDCAFADVVAVDSAYAVQKPPKMHGITAYSDISLLNRDLYGSVFLLDVLEHIEDDVEFLARVSELLMKKGSLFITVPAHPVLFSVHDAFLGHKRRYTRKAFIKILKSSGFVPEKIFYFYFSLAVVRFLEVLAVRFGLKSLSKQAVSRWRYPASSFVTALLVSLLNMDFKICLMLSRIGLHLPGLTLCAICKKTSL